MQSKDGQTRLQKLRLFFLSVYQMLQLAHEAAPFGFWLTMSLQILNGIHPIVTAVITKLIFDILGQIFADSSSVSFREDVVPLLLVQGIILILIQVLNEVQAYFNEYMGMHLSLYTEQKAYSHLLKMQGLRYFESPEFHDTMNMGLQNVRYAPRQILGSITFLMSSSIRILGFIGVLFVFSGWVSVFLLILAALMLIARLRQVRRRHDVSWDNSPKQRRSYYMSHVLAHTEYSQELRLFNIGHYFLNRYLSLSDEIHQERFKIMKQEKIEIFLINFAYTLILIFAWVVVLLRAFARQITLGDVTLYFEALRTVQSSLFGMMNTIADLNERTEFYAYYRKLMQIESSVPILEPLQAVPPLRDCIEIRNVSFRYAETGEEILKNINLTLKKGESTALVGINGAGKSTLVKLLARFYDPIDGQILWDGIDIRHFDPEALRKRMGVVLQDFIRYQTTARENIGLGDLEQLENITLLQDTAKDVGIHDFISDLPQGYETILSRWLVGKGEKGTDLSGGQWQKIAIARTYLRKADFLMLDEPTAALDAEAESDIYLNFAELTQEKASLLISHRFSTVRMADKVAVIEDGCIAEYGTHAELIDNNQTYARLYNLQAQQYTG